MLILGSQSSKAQNKDLSILDPKHAYKTVCKKLFTPELSDAIPTQLVDSIKS